MSRFYLASLTGGNGSRGALKDLFSEGFPATFLGVLKELDSAQATCPPRDEDGASICRSFHHFTQEMKRSAVEGWQISE